MGGRAEQWTCLRGDFLQDFHIVAAKQLPRACCDIVVMVSQEYKLPGTPLITAVLAACNHCSAIRCADQQATPSQSRTVAQASIFEPQSDCPTCARSSTHREVIHTDSPAPPAPHVGPQSPFSVRAEGFATNLPIQTIILVSVGHSALRAEAWDGMGHTHELIRSS